MVLKRKRSYGATTIPSSSPPIYPIPTYYSQCKPLDPQPSPSHGSAQTACHLPDSAPWTDSRQSCLKPQNHHGVNGAESEQMTDDVGKDSEGRYASEGGYDGDKHLGSRTRKRHRDGRPDESEVFASTISKLFQAQQRSDPNGEPSPAPFLQAYAHALSGDDQHADSSHDSMTGSSSSRGDGGSNGDEGERSTRFATSAKGTLHAFWHLPTSSSESSSAASQWNPSPSQHHPRSGMLDRSTTVPSCQDCDRPLLGASMSGQQDSGAAVGGGGHDAMDIDLPSAFSSTMIGFEVEEMSCADCGKLVCDLCAVRADRRICLECVSDRGW